MATVVSGKKSKLRKVRRDALTDLAIELIAEQGLQACTFRALAEKAGSSTAPFTYEFGSRAGLLEAVMARTWEVIWREEDLDHEDPLESLYRACRRGVQIQEETDPFIRAYYEIYFNSPNDPELLGLVEETDGDALPAYRELVEGAQDQGRIEADRNPAEILDQIWALVDGLNLSRYPYPECFPPEKIERLFRDGFLRITVGRIEEEAPG